MGFENSVTFSDQTAGLFYSRGIKISDFPPRDLVIDYNAIFSSIIT